MKYSVVVSTALAIACSQPAHAATDRQARDVFESYSDCITKLHPREAAEVVLSTLSTNEILKSHGRLVDPICLKGSGQLRMPGSDFLRYGLSEALVRREYSGGLPSDIARAGPIAHFQGDESDYQPKPGKKMSPKELAKLEEYRKRDIAIRTMSIYGECVVRADPAGALRLVLSKPDSAQESDTFRSMGGALSSCLPQGMTVQLDKATLRGTLSMNLYRLAHAPRLQQAR